MISSAKDDFFKMRPVIHLKIYSILFSTLISLFVVDLTFAQQEAEAGEEVVFKSGDVILNGRLILPDDAENAPVLVFIGGLYEWGEPHPQREIFIEENLESVFPPAGIGVLYFDPRGIGESTGRWGRATMTDFADDAKAAVNYLQQRKEIDSERIGIVGMDEEGWSAQIVAATSPGLVKLIVTLNTAPFSASRQLVNEYYDQYLCNGESPEQAMQKAEQKALSHQNWVSWLPVTKSWRHLNNKRDFDPTPFMTDIDIPALFIFGKNDRQVYSEWALEKLEQTFPDSLPDNFTIHTINGANRFFHVVDECYEYPRVNEELRLNFSFRFKEVFQDWIFRNL